MDFAIPLLREAGDIADDFLQNWWAELIASAIKGLPLISRMHALEISKQQKVSRRSRWIYLITLFATDRTMRRAIGGIAPQLPATVWAKGCYWIRNMQINRKKGLGAIVNRRNRFLIVAPRHTRH